MFDDTGDAIMWGILVMYAVWAIWAIYQAWGKRVRDEDLKWLDEESFIREQTGAGVILRFPSEEDERDAERQA